MANIWCLCVVGILSLGAALCEDYHSGLDEYGGLDEGPPAEPVQEVKGEDYVFPPQYAYKYGVSDPLTGDVKSAWEHREGDVTKGAYVVLEPSGHMRVVEYSVTKAGGFNADVKHLPPDHQEE